MEQSTQLWWDSYKVTGLGMLKIEIYSQCEWGLHPISSIQTLTFDLLIYLPLQIQFKDKSISSQHFFNYIFMNCNFLFCAMMKNPRIINLHREVIKLSVEQVSPVTFLWHLRKSERIYINYTHGPVTWVIKKYFYSTERGLNSCMFRVLESRDISIRVFMLLYN